MPTKTTGLRELAERVITASPGDSLGLRYDLETQLALIEATVEEFSRSLDLAQLERWRLLVESVEQGFDSRSQSPELRALVRTHRLLLDTAGKLMERRQSASADPELMAEGR